MLKIRNTAGVKKSRKNDKFDEVVDSLRRENKRNLKRRKRQILNNVRKDKR